MESDPMRALTLRPHWAHAVTHLGKRVENRTRRIPAALVGRRVAIHAGATLPAWWPRELDAACMDRRLMHTSIILRAIVCTAVLASCEEAHDDPPPWADPSAAWWWHLADVRTLREPVPVQRGQLGLWRLDAETEAAVRRAEVTP